MEVQLSLNFENKKEQFDFCLKFFSFGAKRFHLFSNEDLKFFRKNENFKEFLKVFNGRFQKKYEKAERLAGVLKIHQFFLLKEKSNFFEVKKIGSFKIFSMENQTFLKKGRCFFEIENLLEFSEDELIQIIKKINLRANNNYIKNTLGDIEKIKEEFFTMKMKYCRISTKGACCAY